MEDLRKKFHEAKSKVDKKQDDDSIIKYENEFSKNNIKPVLDDSVYTYYPKSKSYIQNMIDEKYNEALKKYIVDQISKKFSFQITSKEREYLQNNK